MKIQFNELFDPEAIRVVYSVFADSTTPTNDTQYNYSYPQTEIPAMVGEDFTTYQLTLDVSGDNPSNAFVELDGIRLAPGTEYTITGNLLTLTNPIDETRTLSYTTFNDTSRLYLSTTTRTAPSSGNLVVTVPNPSVPGTMPDLYYSDVNTTWVYVNGRRIQTSRYTYDNANHLTVTGISNGDKVVVTAMIDGGSPNPTGFKLIVKKSGDTEVYRTNPQDRTWLASDFGATDTVIEVADVTRLVEVVSFVQTVSLIDDVTNDYGVSLNLSTNAISHVDGFNVSRGQPLTKDQISIRFYKGTTVAIIDPAGASDGDIIKLTIYVGNLIETNGERISFTELDPITNTISGITRNVQYTVTTSHKKYDFVYSLSPSRKLSPATYNQHWNSSDYVDLGDPLQISSTEAAVFLNSKNN
jgi:hypothetical protein